MSAAKSVRSLPLLCPLTLKTRPLVTLSLSAQEHMRVGMQSPACSRTFPVCMSAFMDIEAYAHALMIAGATLCQWTLESVLLVHTHDVRRWRHPTTCLLLP
jgi:hypothetical protein